MGIFYHAPTSGVKEYFSKYPPNIPQIFPLNIPTLLASPSERQNGGKSPENEAKQGRAVSTSPTARARRKRRFGTCTLTKLLRGYLVLTQEHEKSPVNRAFYCVTLSTIVEDCRGSQVGDILHCAHFALRAQCWAAAGDVRHRATDCRSPPWNLEAPAFGG